MLFHYNVNVPAHRRGSDPDLVVRESFPEEVTCKLRPEDLNAKAKQRECRSIFPAEERAHVEVWM